MIDSETKIQIDSALMNPDKKFWLSPLGEVDDFGDEYDGIMYDARTKYGPWANMSQKSFEIHGMGQVGPGHGQKYAFVAPTVDLEGGSRWLKIAG